jgi:hypothetical protein
MRTFNKLKSTLVCIGFLLVATVPISASWADGGGPSTGPSGACRVEVGSHLVLFTAYQPQLTGTTPFCSDIPALGKTAVVFDYEAKALRGMTVEFEITKEPGGTRIFYQPPEVHATGTFTRDVNFTEAGDYIAHVTLVNEGQKYDSHVPFSVAEEHGLSLNTYIVIAVVLIALGYLLYLSNPAFQRAVGRLLKIGA